MKRLPVPLRLMPLALPLLAAALLAPSAVSAQAIDQRYDPANAGNRIDDPRFQRQMTQSAQSVAESLVGRQANATDQRILGQFTGQQTELLRQMQNAAGAMPRPGASQTFPGGANGGMDERTLNHLLSTPEGRYVLEQIARDQAAKQPVGPRPQQTYGQDTYLQEESHPADSDLRGDEFYDGSQSSYRRGPQMSPGQAMGATILHDLANAAIQRATQPKIIYQQAPQPRP